MNTILKVNESLDAMVNDYFKRTGRTSIDGEIYMEDGKGFIGYQVDGQSLLITALYGDAKYWLIKATEIAKEKGCKSLVGGTPRNPKAYEKLLGTRIIGYILEREVI